MNVLANITLTLHSDSAEELDSLAGRQTDSNGPGQDAGLSAGGIALRPQARVAFQATPHWVEVLGAVEEAGGKIPCSGCWPIFVAQDGPPELSVTSGNPW